MINKFRETCFLICLLAGSVYNFDHKIFRVLALLIWVCAPLLIIISYGWKAKVKAKSDLLLGLLVLSFTFFVFFINGSNLDIKLSGPSAEFITPVLFMVHALMLYSFYLIKDDGGFNHKFISRFTFWLLIVLCLDMLVRYLQNPGCFMNYTCRYEAKTIGFFSTTNVVGQIVAYLVPILFYINFKYKKLTIIMLWTIIFTAMARSAIIALIIVTTIQFFYHNRNWLKNTFALLTFFSLTLFFIFDPLNLLKDGSGQSKVAFFISVFELVANASLKELLFGFGSSYELIVKLIDVNGWSPHASVLKALMYYGLFGLTFFVTLLGRLYLLDGRITLAIISFLIFGLAGAPIYWPTLSVGVCLLLVDKCIKRREVVVGRI